MTYAPATLTELVRFLAKNAGVPTTQFGVVGNSAHIKGYHLGRDRIYDGAGPGIGGSDYSVQLARDKAGLTDAASAIDIKFMSNYAELRKFSKWVVAHCIAKSPGYEDIREVIYSPDGTAVWRWSGEDGVIHKGPGNGDSTHHWHTHISYYRDSEKRNKTNFYAPYYNIVVVPPVVVPPVTPPEVPPVTFYQATIPQGTWMYVNSDLSSNAANLQVSPGRPMLVLKLQAIPLGHLVSHDMTFKQYYVKAADVTVQPIAPPTVVDCQPKVDAAYAKGKTDGIAIGVSTGTAAGILQGTGEEQARIKTVLGLK